MTLELKHLASYLPYELKVVEVNKGKIVSDEFIIDACAFSVGMVGSSTQLDSFELEISFRLTHIKPILRPISDLTKDIDGVVHLVELAKIEHPCSIYHSFTGSSVEVAGNENNSLNFRFDFDNEFFINSEFDCDDIYYPIMYQLELYEYLFKNHFDVYGLIEKGLAIDINTIENV